MELRQPSPKVLMDVSKPTACTLFPTWYSLVTATLDLAIGRIVDSRGLIEVLTPTRLAVGE